MMHGDNDVPALRPPNRIQRRLIQSAGEIAAEDANAILYQHTVLCQTALPYRDPGDDVRRWKRSQGGARLEIEAGRAYNPERDDIVDVGLPFGPKPRLILAHLNAEALRTGKPEIEVEASLSAFVQRVGLCRNGRSIRAVKDQLTRLATAKILLVLALPGTPIKQFQAYLVGGFEQPWLAKDEERRRVPWPSSIILSSDYYDSLQQHAVPLDERALATLSNSALALDLYAWLAQRLHRINPRKPAFVPWTALKGQFGVHYAAMFKFRQSFCETLQLVLSQYPGANVDPPDRRGLTLHHSRPPIPARLNVVRRA
jgi:Plasmid encoded RepA protein